MSLVLVATDIYAQVAEQMQIGLDERSKDPTLKEVIDDAQAKELEKQTLRPWLHTCGVQSVGSSYGQVLHGLLYAGLSHHALTGHEDEGFDLARRRLGLWAGTKGQHLLYQGLGDLSVAERVSVLQEAQRISKPYPFAAEALRGALAVRRTEQAIRMAGLDLGVRLGTIGEDQLCHTDLVITAHHHPERGGVLVQVKSGPPGSTPEAVCTDAFRVWRVSQLPLGMRSDEYLTLVNTMYSEAYRRWLIDHKRWYGLVVQVDPTPCAPDDPGQQVLTERVRTLLIETGRFGPGSGLPTSFPVPS